MIRRRIRRRIRWLAAATVLLTSCGGDDHAGRSDPLTSEGPQPDGVFVLHTQSVEGVPPAEPDGPPPSFALSIGETCLLANVGLAFSTCMSPRPGEGSTMYDGGVHDDVSLAWLVTGDTSVTRARFWLLDGTTVDLAPVPLEGDDPPIVFGHAVAATNEIVGIELLDAEGHVVMALSVDPEA